MGREMRAGERWLRVGIACVAAFQLVGCIHHGSGSGGSGTGPASDTSLIGNWQFQATSTANPPFTGLSGFVNEPGLIGDSTATTASLQVQSNGCFASTKVIDLEGFSKNSLAQLTSFPSDSQVVTLGLSQQCSNGVSLCGTFTVAGGCADKSTGNITGIKLAPLAGTFSTSAGAPAGVQIAIKQAAQGTGQGSFQVSGNLAFTGVICATSGTIDIIQSALSGSTLHLVSQTNAPGNPLLTIDATLNAAATTLTIKSAEFTSSNCFQSLNGATLSKT